MRNWSFSVARVSGVDVRLHLTFLLLLIFVWAPEYATREAAQRAVALVALVFASVVVHELGHALAAWHHGNPARSIVLLPIGGVSLMDENAPAGSQSSREVRLALGGPLASLAAAAVAAPIVHHLCPREPLLPPTLHPGHLATSLVWMNVFLGVLNLLPAYPLDGGRILRAWMLRKHDAIQATRRAVSLGQFLSTSFLLAGMFGAIYEKDWSYWLMLLGFFLFVGAQLEDRSAMFHAVLKSVRMEEVMLTGFTTLSPADTLEDALAKAVHCLQEDFPVVRGNELVGIISRRKILEALRTDGNGYLQPAMTSSFEVAHRSDSLASVFGKITSRTMPLVPVVDGERLVGIVTLQNLMHSMALLAETRKLQQKAENE
jgi:Zn-dependent protease/predicted transcriptional regulator